MAGKRRGVMWLRSPVLVAQNFEERGSGEQDKDTTTSKSIACIFALRLLFSSLLFFVRGALRVFGLQFTRRCERIHDYFNSPRLCSEHAIFKASPASQSSGTCWPCSIPSILDECHYFSGFVLSAVLRSALAVGRAGPLNCCKRNRKFPISSQTFSKSHLISAVRKAEPGPSSCTARNLRLSSRDRNEESARVDSM